MNRVTKILLVLVVILMLCSCDKSQKANRFYEKSPSYSDPYGGTDLVIDVSIDKNPPPLTSDYKVKLTIGLGGVRFTRIPAGAHAYIKIKAPGCIINGTRDCYEKHYYDFYTNDIYNPRIEKHSSGYDEKFPNYFEQIEIQFSEYMSTGVIEFEIVSTHDEMALFDVASFSIKYSMNNGVLTFAK